MSTLEAITFSGSRVGFSREAYVHALSLYSVEDIRAYVEELENSKPWERVDRKVANFFRDFAAIQEQNHPDFDRGVAIGSLATRIELATGQIPAERMEEVVALLADAKYEYELTFAPKN